VEPFKKITHIILRIFWFKFLLESMILKLLQYVGAHLNKSAWTKVYVKVCMGRLPYLPLPTVKNNKVIKYFFTIKYNLVTSYCLFHCALLNFVFCIGHKVTAIRKGRRSQLLNDLCIFSIKKIIIILKNIFNTLIGIVFGEIFLLPPSTAHNFV